VAETLPTSEFHLTRRTILVGVAVLVAVVVVVVLLQDAGGGDALGLITQHASSSYLGVTLLIFLDAVCPVFPGETTLNAASTLAAQGKFNLGLVILTGAVGAIAGDSALYWTARLFSKRFDQRIDHVKQNKKVAEALAFIPTISRLVRNRRRPVERLHLRPRLRPRNRARELPARVGDHLRDDHHDPARRHLLEGAARPASDRSAREPRPVTPSGMVIAPGLIV
jgi:hypothetical protein